MNKELEEFIKSVSNIEDARIFEYDSTRSHIRIDKSFFYAGLWRIEGRYAVPLIVFSKYQEELAENHLEYVGFVGKGADVYASDYESIDEEVIFTTDGFYYLYVSKDYQFVAMIKESV